MPTFEFMNLLAKWKNVVLAALFIFQCVPCKANEYEGVDGPNVRFIRHEDGSRSVFTRSPDNKVLTKKTFSANGVLTMLTTYRMDENGNPKSCKIFDGSNNEMFKVSYGYNKFTGQLVSELMFDARVVRTDKNTGKEMPVQVIRYVYDAEGKRSAPIVINTLPGKTFEQVFGIKSSALESNPFKNPPAAAPKKR